jgi:hypothetical protein
VRTCVAWNESRSIEDDERDVLNMMLEHPSISKVFARTAVNLKEHFDWSNYLKFHPVPEEVDVNGVDRLSVVGRPHILGICPRQDKQRVSIGCQNIVYQDDVLYCPANCFINLQYGSDSPKSISMVGTCSKRIPDPTNVVIVGITLPKMPLKLLSVQDVEPMEGFGGIGRGRHGPRWRFQRYARSQRPISVKKWTIIKSQAGI